ncbi:putative Ig domain-containing protein [Novosphingobium sp.]|uniref:putative Ig domain-containing protein n=1 Tax=Novosphingobium sp. TaxID=1874826 RepID=UPI002623CC69|nr:putative Ig domain-containing protein [Novosphingobium sp.]
MPNIFYGDATNNYIVSANGEDIIYGYDGIDELHGRGGTDQLFGGNGEDTLFGEDGTDTLDGGADNDQLDGGYGNDTLTGGSGDDLFTVNDDTDTITDLGDGNDNLSVGPGAIANATVVAAWAASSATINDGTVNISTVGFAVDLGLAGGGTGFNVTNTGAATTLTGSAQNDTLTAGVGADTLIGGSGDDRFVSRAHLATVVYAGNQADYTVTKVGVSTWEVVDNNVEDGNDGTDTLVGIPTIQFADGSVDLPLNQAPVLALPIADRALKEDAPLSYTIPAGTFSDPDGDTLSLSATLANGSALPTWLVFDADTGTFSGTPPKDYNGQIALKVTATDGEYSVSDSFTLSVTPVNDAPVITSGGGGAEADYTVLENIREVTRVTASDVDAGAVLRYAIVGGADAGLFKISSRTGGLIFKAAPDFEDRADADGNGVYDVVVRVSDGWASDTQTLHITVGDVVNEVLRGSTTANDLQGAGGADRLYGYAGNDTLDGGAGNDKLYGGLGADALLGGGGTDRLYGGEGVDTLTGGAGLDLFVFDLSPNTAGNVDVITDFSHAERDKIALSLADFSGFAKTGAITADQFYAAAGATSAQDATDQLVYNTSNGALYYDADGVGGKAAVQIATIANFDTAGLAYNDILILA